MASSSSMPAPWMTTDEYLRMRETMRPQELVWGVVRDAPAPAPGHQWVVGQFFVALREHVRQHARGRAWLSPIDVVLDRESHLVVQPEVIVVSEARAGIVTDRVWGAPDLVIEVLSPRPRIGTLAERIGWFAQYGVRECWLVHQEAQEVEILEFAAASVARRRVCLSEENIRSGVLPEFQASPATILGHH
jgi:Uma2 family endonuclease